MSRIGKRVIAMPKSVSGVVLGQLVTIKGPKGELSRVLSSGVSAVIDAVTNELSVFVLPDISSVYQGLENALLRNMIIGVSVGFSKKLILKGTGYRALLAGNKLELKLMKSHPVFKDIPAGLKVEVEKGGTINIFGINKQLVGDFAAEIKRERPVEPYKGKGIYEENDYIIRKEGKKSKK